MPNGTNTRVFKLWQFKKFYVMWIEIKKKLKLDGKIKLYDWRIIFPVYSIMSDREAISMQYLKELQMHCLPIALNVCIPKYFHPYGTNTSTWTQLIAGWHAALNLRCCSCSMTRGQEENNSWVLHEYLAAG